MISDDYLRGVLEGEYPISDECGQDIVKELLASRKLSDAVEALYMHCESKQLVGIICETFHVAGYSMRVVLAALEALKEARRT